MLEAPRVRAHRDPADPLRDAHIVLGVTGGIAAYKAAELARLFVKAGAHVHVAMTPRAREFVGPLTFQALTGHAVFTDLFDLAEEGTIGHIAMADRADLVVIAPATANATARLAAGMADDVVTAIALATRAPVLLAPAMNVNMWNHPVTQANLAKLVDLVGVRVVGPGDGFLACRWTGPGRLAEPADIVEAAALVLSPQDLAGKRIVVSAGPTYEAIDPVRFVGNRSSGKMGIALAAAARRRGADVALILGPSG
jgi:phosphopantothenoylcysteine decarboxylase / phosphopantothenate---cysteine ligase